MTPNCSTFAGCSPKTRIILVHRNAMLSMRRDKVNDTKQPVEVEQYNVQLYTTTEEAVDLDTEATIVTAVVKDTVTDIAG